MTRTFVCPVCGYSGFTLSEPAATVDVDVEVGCLRCSTADGLTVWLVETSDPRLLILDGRAA